MSALARRALSRRMLHSTTVVAASVARPLFPSVQRLLQEHGVAPDGIIGTGVRGMLTKGDVLAHLKLASSPTGTYKEPPSDMRKPAGLPASKPAPQKELTGDAIRQLIIESIVKAGKAPAAVAVSPLDASFESIVSDYLRTSAKQTPIPPYPATTSNGYLDGLI